MLVYLEPGFERPHYVRELLQCAHLATAKSSYNLILLQGYKCLTQSILNHAFLENDTILDITFPFSPYLSHKERKFNSKQYIKIQTNLEHSLTNKPTLKMEWRKAKQSSKENSSFLASRVPQVITTHKKGAYPYFTAAFEEFY